MLNIQQSFQPDTRLVISIVFSIGVIASLALILGALIAVAYLLNVAVSALAELASNIASVYNRSDSLMQFFMLFIGCYIAFHVVRFVARPYIMRGAK
jgi:hypothetical protein